MSLAIVYARGQLGLNAPLVTIETHLTNGLPGFSMVGLPETAVRESKERVRSAIITSGFEFPARRITVNLAPADIPKEGTRFDLAIALGILAATEQISASVLPVHEYIAELALTGELRAVRGLLPAALAARTAGRALICAEGDAHEASLCRDLVLFAPSTLRSVCAHLERTEPLSPFERAPHPPSFYDASQPDLVDVKGQFQAKRALEIAAAGGHNLLMVGPPGTGKSMLAQRLVRLLPLLDETHALEVATIRSIANDHHPSTEWRLPPFRAPHHTASAAAIIGGGALPKPGEVTLAHHGVLFLDELPEFDRRVLEVLREPLENFRVTIARAACHTEFPSDFQLVAAMNPCNCGHFGDATSTCTCSPERLAKYRSRISGPLLDRIDLQIEVPRERHWLMHEESHCAELSVTVRERVIAARERQVDRQGCLNKHLSTKQLERFATLTLEARALLHRALNHFSISARGYHRLLKVAMTIVDLARVEVISEGEISEAIGLRQKLQDQSSRRQ